MKNRILGSIAIIFCIQFSIAQTLDVSYLNPQLGPSGTYKFLRFGNDSNYPAGFMWNESNSSYGDGNDFSIFTYNNRDLTFRTGTGNVIIFPESGGNVGIGTKTPGAKLQVNGDFYLYDNQDENNDRWKETHFYWQGHSLIMGSKKGRYAHNKIELRPGGSNEGELRSYFGLYQALDENNVEERIHFTTSSSHPSWINAGNVGIGTTTPDEKLTVKGKIHTQEVKVDLNGAIAPDYVFKKEYDLKSLGEVEIHIQKEGHLPNIPSAREMEVNGLNLKEMNLKLLEKIEELTLYTIEQQNLIQRQAEMLTEVKKDIEVLKKHIR